MCSQIFKHFTWRMMGNAFFTHLATFGFHLKIYICCYFPKCKEIFFFFFFCLPIKGLNCKCNSTYEPKQTNKQKESVYSPSNFHTIPILALALIILDLISQLFWALFRSVTVICSVPWISLSRLIGWSLCDLLVGENK